MLSLSLKNVAAAALAFTALFAAQTASAAGTVEVVNYANMGSIDYRQMGYTNENGDFISVVGQRILGAWAELVFEPAARKDAKLFTVQMVVPVEGAKSELFKIDASQLIPMGEGQYRAVITSTLFNGTVRDGRYSIETFGTNKDGEWVPLNGAMKSGSGFHFIVTRPD